MTIKSTTESAREARARRAARRVGLIAKKSRARRGTVDNFGGFMLVDGFTNTIVLGERFDLDPDDVIEYCCRS
jgi:hypothetical protein